MRNSELFTFAVLGLLWAPVTAQVEFPPLDYRLVTLIRVSTNAFTTVRFPGNYSDLVGMGFATNQSGQFQILFREGMPTFSVRSLGVGNTGMLNVAYQGRTHVLRFVTDTNSVHAVTFLAEKESNPSTNGKSVPNPGPTPSQNVVESPSSIPSRPEVPSATKPELIPIPRALPAARSPEEIHAMRLISRLSFDKRIERGESATSETKGNFRVSCKCYRLREEDLLILELKISNLSDKKITIEGVGVTNSGRSIIPFYVDIASVLKARATSTGWLMFKGVLRGTRPGTLNEDDLHLIVQAEDGSL